MPCFDTAFRESKGQPIVYKGDRLVLVDKFPVENGDVLIASIEESTGDRRQGLCIDITGWCEFEGKTFKKGKGIRMHFWEDTAPKEIRLKIFTKNNFVWIENIWENLNSYLMESPSGERITKQSKSIDYGHNGAAMIVEELPDGRRYRCNDGAPDDDFNDIIFTVRKINP